ncbi:MAG: hypothetical protein KIS96_03440 [Bauldia sp.]|nr:hypothetical protein [Bauldia sp.]
MLPGMIPIIRRRPALALRAIASNVNTADITIPTSGTGGVVSVGDFAVMAWWSQNTSGGVSNVNAGSGWVSPQNTTSGVFRGRLWHKVLTAADIGATIPTQFGDARNTNVLLIFGGGFTSAAYTAGGGQTTTGDPDQQNANASGATPPVLVAGFLGVYSGGSLGFSVNTPTWGATGAFTDGTNNGVRYGYTIYNPGQTPADHTYDKADTGDNWLAGGYWVLS